MVCSFTNTFAIDNILIVFEAQWMSFKLWHHQFCLMFNKHSALGLKELFIHRLQMQETFDHSRLSISPIWRRRLSCLLPVRSMVPPSNLVWISSLSCLTWADYFLLKLSWSSLKWYGKHSQASVVSQSPYYSFLERSLLCFWFTSSSL